MTAIQTPTVLVSEIEKVKKCNLNGNCFEGAERFGSII